MSEYHNRLTELEQQNKRHIFYSLIGLITSEVFFQIHRKCHFKHTFLISPNSSLWIVILSKCSIHSFDLHLNQFFLQTNGHYHKQIVF